MALITPTEHEKREWSRMAQAAYAADCNRVGHRYGAAAACIRIGQPMGIERFDELQEGYRAWLMWNDFKAAEAHCR